MGTLRRTGRVEATTSAALEQVWEVVSDITRVGEWSHECRVGSWLDGAAGAYPGARFTGTNRVGKSKWSRVNEVTNVEVERDFGWRTVPTRFFPDSTQWHIRLEPLAGEAGGTRIVQTFDVVALNPIMDRLIYLFVPVHRDRLPALAEDIRRLGAVAAGHAVDPMVNS